MPGLLLFPLSLARCDACLIKPTRAPPTRTQKISLSLSRTPTHSLSLSILTHSQTEKHILMAVPCWRSTFSPSLVFDVVTFLYFLTCISLGVIIAIYLDGRLSVYVCMAQVLEVIHQLIASKNKPVSLNLPSVLSLNFTFRRKKKRGQIHSTHSLSHTHLLCTHTRTHTHQYIFCTPLSDSCFIIFIVR
jgi:hypothetical protein